jgi:glucose/arabinose dehydrogenase
LWSNDHGPQGGDEINNVRGGRDYGWPDVTYGVQYHSRQAEKRTNVRVGNALTPREGVEQPLNYRIPSNAPSGMMFYTGERFPEWKGDLFVGAMAGQALVRLVLKGDRVVAEERLLTDLRQRIREVRQGPDGYIYAIAGASLVRIVPKR